MGAVLAVVLRPREAQCPLVRCIARELVTCLVMQPIMDFASPGYINELIEYVFLAIKDDGSKEAGEDQSPNLVSHNSDCKEAGEDQSPNVVSHNSDHAVAADVAPVEFTSRKNASSYNQVTDSMVSRTDNHKEISPDALENLNSNLFGEEHSRPADWARILEVATQRRTETLMPENLDNMWTIGRNYKKKIQKIAAGGLQAPMTKGSGIYNAEHTRSSGKQMSTHRPVISSAVEDKVPVQLPPKLHTETRLSNRNNNVIDLSRGINKEQSIGKAPLFGELKDTAYLTASGNKGGLKRSNSTSALKVQPNMEKTFTREGGGPIISEFYSPDFCRHTELHTAKSVSDIVFCSEGILTPKLRCRVVGAYFEKLGSKSFAVYSIAVTDADRNTWFVKRRYSNFERLHRHLKDIPNYTLHLPPKRIFSSSTEDAFVLQRCIQLDKYLQDLLSIANVAEQHEVWDFLSVSSKNYSFGRSSSVMRTLAVNVDDAMDDIMRQFKGVSGGLMRKVVGSSSLPYEEGSLSWNADEISNHLSWQNTTESAKSLSDNEDGDKDGTRGHEEVGSSVQASGWHSDNELNSKGFPPRVVKHCERFRSLDSEKKHGSEAESLSVSLGGYPAIRFPITSDNPVGMPLEWTPPKLSVPVLNLVDKIFQLKRRGWLRRQVFWISKQILQLMMEDAIDDWLLRQIQLLRRDEVIAQGVRWIQDVLWPDGTFFTRLNTQSQMNDCQPNQTSFQTTSRHTKASKPGSFEERLEAARRASDVKKIILNGAPSTLVSLIGQKQYRRSAKDIYYFLQSTICLKQLAYGTLELVLISVFPELRDVVLDVHEKTGTQPV
ncbi:hypothetical protein CsSME_00015699 [Camellia sinensis var. sinensis]